MRFFMSPKPAIAAAAAILALACAAPAAAAVIIYTYTGTISEGYDETGVFGTAGRDLTGLAFTAQFRLDDATWGAQHHDYPFRTGIEGQFEWNPIRASLTIAGGSPMTFGQGAGTQIQYDVESREGFLHGHGAYGETDYVDTNDRLVEHQELFMGGDSVGHDYLPSPDYHTLPSLTAAATPDLNWYGHLLVDDYLYDLDTGEVLSRNSAFATFAPTALSVTTPVPEPAAWALMLTGFFGAGAALRSRRRAVADARQPAR